MKWLKKLFGMNTEQQKTQESYNGKSDTLDSKKSNSNKIQEEEEKENKILIEKFEVEDTPFTIVRQDKDWYVLMGKYRMTESLSGKAETEEFAKRFDWQIIMQVIGVMIEEYQNINEIRERLEELEKDITIMKL